ncbi:uncharacterized protein [Rutidosis leptorrhynchoides]|uniref:uncharacterized protein isoform X2 n=1 Tax=Rutidosis leptorrhynchoides TaxID=125765 RepID=UPI003A9993AB
MVTINKQVHLCCRGYMWSQRLFYFKLIKHAIASPKIPHLWFINLSSWLTNVTKISTRLLCNMVLHKQVAKEVAAAPKNDNGTSKEIIEWVRNFVAHWLCSCFIDVGTQLHLILHLRESLCIAAMTIIFAWIFGETKLNEKELLVENLKLGLFFLVMLARDS